MELANNLTNIQKLLFLHQDIAYRDFHARLMPTIPKEKIIGVRIPVLRKLAKELSDSLKSGSNFVTAALKSGCDFKGVARDETGIVNAESATYRTHVTFGENLTITPAGIESFLNELPHVFYEENNLHSFLLETEKDFETCIKKIQNFLPFVDNWATCDSLRPKCFAKNRENLLPLIDSWFADNKTYTIRFGIGQLMIHFLDKDFSPSFLQKVAAIKSEEYYVNMMIAWYFATALAKQWGATFPFIKEKRLSPWVHNKTIQKAIESYRVPEEHKAELRLLRIKGE